MDWSVLWTSREALAGGLAITVGFALSAIVGATVAGVLIGCLASTRSYLLLRLTGAYTGLLRNLPLVVKMFFFYFVLGWPEIPAALTALILHQSAYIADVTASGLRAIERGQFDAGLALGLRRMSVMRHVVLPQLARVVLSPMTTQYVSIVKNTSIVALIGVADLTFQTQQINVETFRGFEAATAATLLYMLVAGAVIVGMSWLQRRWIIR